MKVRYLVVEVTAFLCLVFSIFSTLPTKSLQYAQGEYNPYADINNDTKVNILDSILVGNAFGTTGDPSGKWLSEASYIIYLNCTGCCFAKNGTNGNVDFCSGNASSVINSAIQALALTGGEIFLRQGTYILDSPLIVNVAGLTLRGESRQSVWICPDSNARPSTLVNITRQSVPIGETGRDDADTGNTRVSDLSFNNTVFTSYNLTSAIYIDISGTHNIVWLPTVEDCYFINLDAVHTSRKGNPNWCIQAPTFRTFR